MLKRKFVSLIFAELGANQDAQESQATSVIKLGNNN